MRTLSRYLAARFVGLFAVILVAALAAIVIVELLIGAEALTDPDAGSGNIVGRLVLRISGEYLRDLIPLSAFFATFFTFALAVRWFEWTAIEAAGISPLRAALPVLVAVGGVGLVAGIVQETVGPAVVARLASAERPDDEDLLFRAGAFWYHKGRTVYSISSADAATETLRGVEVFERTARGQLAAHMRADRVSVHPDGAWTLHSASVRRFDPDRPHAQARMTSGQDIRLEVGKSPANMLAQTDAAALPAWQLVEYLDAHASDDFPGSRAARERLRQKLHERASEPGWIVAMALLAIPIALMARPGASLAPTGVVALAAAAAMLLTRNLTHGLVGREILPNPSTIWIVLVLVAGLGALALWDRTRASR